MTGRESQGQARPAEAKSPQCEAIRHAHAAAASWLRPAGQGDHWVYTHSKLPYPLTIDPRNPLLPVYVGKAIRAIDEVLGIDDQNT